VPAACGGGVLEGVRSQPAVDSLSTLSLFRQLTPRTRAQADTLMTQVTVPAGRELCRQDSLAREAFVIVEGTAAVIQDGHVIATLRSGDLVGEMALLSRSYRRTATVRAVSTLTVLAMNTREFEGLLDIADLRARARAIADARLPAA
jgi:CRP-like cAMP-binding protein